MTRSEGFGLLMMIVAALIWSGISPHDRLTWFIEVIWVIAAIALLLAARPHFRITLLR